MTNAARDGNRPCEDAGPDSTLLSGREKNRKLMKKVVLVMVDDDEDDCVLVEAALKEARMNCTFRCMRDGVDMLNYLQRKGPYGEGESAPSPDLILLDLNMPKMNGREVLGRLKSDERFRSIPVIVLTTSKDNEDVRACYDLGANSYVTKQPSFEGLLSAMATLMDYWLTVATLPPQSQAHLSREGNNRP